MHHSRAPRCWHRLQVLAVLGASARRSLDRRWRAGHFLGATVALPWICLAPVWRRSGQMARLGRPSSAAGRSRRASVAAQSGGPTVAVCSTWTRLDTPRSWRPTTSAATDSGRSQAAVLGRVQAVVRSGWTALRLYALSPSATGRNRRSGWRRSTGPRTDVFAPAGFRGGLRTARRSRMSTPMGRRGS